MRMSTWDMARHLITSPPGLSIYRRKTGEHVVPTPDLIGIAIIRSLNSSPSTASPTGGPVRSTLTRSDRRLFRRVYVTSVGRAKAAGSSSPNPRGSARPCFARHKTTDARPECGTSSTRTMAFMLADTTDPSRPSSGDPPTPAPRPSANHQATEPITSRWSLLHQQSRACRSTCNSRFSPIFLAIRSSMP